MRSTLTRSVCIAALAALALTACGDDDDDNTNEAAGSNGGGTELNCDLGNEITAEFEALTGQATPPTTDQIQEIKSKVEDFGKPDGIADEVQDVLDALDVFVEELDKGADFDQERLGNAAESSNAAGQTIEKFLADNC